MSEQFNGLSPVEHETISILAEECCEVGQVVGKIQRHGLESDALGKYPHTNRLELEKEIADVGISIEVLLKLGVVTEDGILRARLEKLAKLRKHPERFHHITPDLIPLD
jgi:NTP pyrophosphatase (non-canonical NTP hydrolase)